MKAGRMRSWITVYEPVEVINGFGESEITSYEQRGRWRAERTNISGRRTEEASEIFSDYTIRLNIRDAHRIEPNWRVACDDLLYTVVAVEPYKWLGMKTIICERVNQ